MHDHRPITPVFLLIATLACAAHQAHPQALHADLTYPRLPDEVCDSTHEVSQIRLQVVDSTGSPLPQVPVFLIPFSFGKPGEPEPARPPGVFTDSQGQAVLEGRSRVSDYAVVVTMAAFVPEVRAIAVPLGCSGRMKISLRLATRERLDALNSGRISQ